MVVAELSPFFVAISPASLLWYRLHSTAIPPFVLKSYGVSVTCSTSNTRLIYWRFFSVSCCLNIWYLFRSLYLCSIFSHQKKPTSASPRTPYQLYPAAHQLRSQHHCTPCEVVPPPDPSVQYNGGNHPFSTS